MTTKSWVDLLSLLFSAFVPLSFAQSAAQPAEPQPTEHTFVIHNFKTESGAVLPEARIVYGTYGQLDAAKDNAILLPSHYMADMHGYGWLIGPGHALDPARHFLITSELFGNGRSSSPSNTPSPCTDRAFPS
jgi:homoserine O-acetyltransferase/O-succinyltransferase